jgi:predicted adenine nucleotide alpha hydrolase (AANH) superfamily ATPase
MLDEKKKSLYNILMNKVNYDKRMQELMKIVPKGTKLLLHSCCAPCSSACLERLHEVFDISVLYYNPNIDEEPEYQKRKAEQIRFLQETGFGSIIDCDYDAEAFIAMSQGYENEPERGARCYRCYALRLSKTAEMAKQLGIPYFATTLTLSPLKNVEWLNEIGEKEGGRYGVKYLCSDFKKQGGYLRSIQLSNEYKLYRQDFCGCKFSKRKAETPKEKENDAE